MHENDRSQRALRARFESLYAADPEPWTYSRRAAEVLRHDDIARTVRRLRPSWNRVLDAGCSVGQLTARLAGAAPVVHAFDVSAAAVGRARERCARAGAGTRFHFCQASSVDPPFPDGSFDLVLMCDGVHSWGLSPEDQARTLRRAYRLLVPGGYGVFTDHLKPRDFARFVARIEESPLDIVRVRYLHNRLWYSLERGLWRVKDRRPFRTLFASRAVARGLMAVSALAGKRGAKHLMVITRRRAGAEAGA